MYNSEEIVKDLLEIMQVAIASGDWKADSACDPSMVMDRAEGYLRAMGWVIDGITGETWFKDE